LTYLILKKEIHLEFYSAKDDLCVLELMNKPVLRKRKIRIKKLLVPVISKALKEPVVFMKEPAAG
jgi:hypothetical protein